jgi:AcrR family transcriptional regulator
VTSPARPRPGRGPYAKTAARRAHILDVALEVFGKQGYRGGSVRTIAQRVGLTDAGVLHHFGSKQQLLTAVLEHRESIARNSRPAQEGLGLLDGLRELIAHNATVPGLVRLFVTLAAEATDPEHPAHDFFVARYDDVTGYFVAQLTAAKDAGELSEDADLLAAAHQLIAVMDGLQVQWLLNERLDMVATFDQFLEGFRTTLGVRARTRPKFGE